MTTSETFAIIKPDATQHTGAILRMAEDAGFRFCRLKKLWVSRERWQQFYVEHAGKPFFDDLCRFMSSGDVTCALMVREGDYAVSAWRSLLGATDSRFAAPGTVRALYGSKTDELYRNAAHGSDSYAAARREYSLFYEWLCEDRLDRLEERVAELEEENDLRAARSER